MKIILVGLPGSGKSFWGRQLAAYYQVKLIDLDIEIINYTGSTINDIFAEQGEEWFRKTEADILRGVLGQPGPYILSTGGGAPCFHQNMEAINAVGISIFLNRSPESIAKRLLQKGFDKRPLLKDKKDTLAEELQQKLLQRKPFYTKAHISLNQDEMQLESFINALESH